MAYVCEDCNSGLPPVDEECKSDARTWVFVVMKNIMVVPPV